MALVQWCSGYVSFLLYHQGLPPQILLRSDLAFWLIGQPLAASQSRRLATLGQYVCALTRLATRSVLRCFSLKGSALSWGGNPAPAPTK